MKEIDGRNDTMTKEEWSAGGHTEERGGAFVKHWHGAKKDSWFSHLAVEVPGEETSNEWCEPVMDEAYGKLE